MMLPVFTPNEEVVEEDDVEDVEELNMSSTPGKVLFVALTSDRGLCGGVNSAVTRRIRREADHLQAQNREFEIISIGDKGRPQLQRIYPESFSQVIDEAWKSPLNFATVRSCCPCRCRRRVPPSSARALAQTSAVTEFLCGKDYEEMRIVYNVFKSAIAYDTVTLTMPKFASYDDMSARTAAASRRSRAPAHPAPSRA